MIIKSNFSEYYDQSFMEKNDGIVFHRDNKLIYNYENIDKEMIEAYALMGFLLNTKSNTISFEKPRSQFNYIDDEHIESLVKKYGWKYYFTNDLSKLSCNPDIFSKLLSSCMYIVGFCDYLYTSVKLPTVRYNPNNKRHYIFLENGCCIRNGHYYNAKQTEKIKQKQLSVLYDSQFYYSETNEFIKHFNKTCEISKNRLIHNTFSYRSLAKLLYKNRLSSEQYMITFVNKNPIFNDSLFETIQSPIFLLNFDLKRNNDCYGQINPSLETLNFDKVYTSIDAYSKLYNHLTINN